MSLIHEFPAPPRAVKGHGSARSSEIDLITSRSDALANGSHLNGKGEDRHQSLQPSSSEPVASPSTPTKRMESEEDMDLEGQSGDGYTDYDQSGSEFGDEISDEVIVHVEVRQKQWSNLPSGTISNIVTSLLRETSRMEVCKEVPEWRTIPLLEAHVERIWVAESSNGLSILDDLSTAVYRAYVYKAAQEGVQDVIADMDEDDDDGEQPAAAAQYRELPSAELDGLWENLIYADDLKERLLRHIFSASAFSEKEIDFNVVSWNRMVLLHGPPGTGKTSLCRALAQKLSIRLSNTYSEGRIVEINSHSLFSKWFSESGKLVQKLFSAVHGMIENPDCFVIVMIDEVESLTAARAGAISGNEPSDAIRVVNALLTQLDKLKTKKNVMVMTTSNIAGAIDPAFVDRADIKEYVGLPPPEAIYWILTSILEEMMDKGMVKRCAIVPWRELHSSSVQTVEAAVALGRSGLKLEMALRLRDLVLLCAKFEMSGRFLRRIPMLAHGRFMMTNNEMDDRPRSVRKWIKAMEKVVWHEQAAREKIAQADGQRGQAKV